MTVDESRRKQGKLTKEWAESSSTIRDVQKSRHLEFVVLV